MADTAVILGPYRQGEVPEPYTYTFLDSNGDPAALTPGTWTSKFEIRRWNTTTPVTELDATVENQVSQPGEVTVTFPGMTDYGDFDGELWVGNGTNRYSQRFRWVVRPNVAAPAI